MSKNVSNTPVPTYEMSVSSVKDPTRLESLNYSSTHHGNLQTEVHWFWTIVLWPGILKYLFTYKMWGLESPHWRVTTWTCEWCGLLHEDNEKIMRAGLLTNSRAYSFLWDSSADLWTFTHLWGFYVPTHNTSSLQQQRASPATTFRTGWMQIWWYGCQWYETSGELLCCPIFGKTHGCCMW